MKTPIMNSDMASELECFIPEIFRVLWKNFEIKLCGVE